MGVSKILSINLAVFDKKLIRIIPVHNSNKLWLKECMATYMWLAWFGQVLKSWDVWTIQCGEFGQILIVR